MKKQKKLIVGNWKMNPTDVDEARDIVKAVKRASSKLKKSQVVVCPPHIYIPLFSLSKSTARGGNFALGAQNANAETLGSYTGEVSYSQLYQFGVRCVILGHSERRKMGETDEMINKKVKSVVNGGMTAIVCVGETKRDHNGDYLDVIKDQVLKCLNDVSKKLLENVVIAYEPVWAIGATEAMNPRELQEISIFIKKTLKDFFGIMAEDTRVIYGGSVDRVNADSLVRDGDVSGLLIGRESLNAKGFIEIMKLVDAINFR